MQKRTYQSIAKQVMIVIVPVLFMLALLLGVIFGAYDRQQEQRHLGESHKLLHQQLASLIAEPMWYFEYRVVETISKAVVNNMDISYIKIQDELGNTLVELGDASKVPIKLISTLPIKTKSSSVVGKLTLGFTDYTGSLLKYYLMPLFIALALLMVLSVLLYIVWKRQIYYPLEKIRFAMESSQGGAEKKVELSLNNEFGLIADTYNQMLERVAEHRIEVEQLVQHDQLTGLLNHSTFAKKASKKLQQDTDQSFWFLFIDIDRFKWINDTHGHVVGDEVLKVIAKRLMQLLSGALISRFGGDEFVALAPLPHGDAAQFVETIKQGVNAPIILPNLEIFPSVCIGIACFPNDGQKYDDLLQKADAAMYQAKVVGRNVDYMYNNFLDQLNQRQLRVVEVLQSYIFQDCIDMYFQPIFDSETGLLISAEALLRLPKINNIGTSIEVFIKVAEESGYIHEIDRIARQKAFSYFKSWQNAGFTIKEIHINTSAVTFSMDNFVEEFLMDMQRCGIKGYQVVLEITESTVIENMVAAVEILNALKLAGVRIAMDDFGKGSSSLGLLTELPIDILKLDQTFFSIPAEGSSSNSHIILKYIIPMAMELGLEIVAEGIESEKLVTELRLMGCKHIQGHIYSKALPAKEFAQRYLQV